VAKFLSGKILANNKNMLSINLLKNKEKTP
jgi:hypothetical protein